jgi:DNA-binding NarL/FixJ family response regulator
LSVLIVDDHAMFRARARNIVEAAGLEVVGEAADAASALAECAALHPDLVLLDIQLPDGDGFAVAESLSGGADPPAVVLVSSREALDFGSRLRNTSALGFIQKEDLSATTLQALLRDASR